MSIMRVRARARVFLWLMIEGLSFGCFSWISLGGICSRDVFEILIACYWVFMAFGDTFFGLNSGAVVEHLMY